MLAKTKKSHPEAQNPLILRSHRLMEAFAKSDDERDFYLDNVEGFIVYVDLDKSEEELALLEKELEAHPDRYCLIPKLTFYETKKIMEGFVNEKVYDIDTKEKLLDIIQSREARENFLEFIYDHHAELEKWQQYYQERSRIRIIEWLRQHHFYFVFEEDLDLSASLIERLKQHLFDKKVSRDLEVARKTLATKAKTYYSNEALNPKPKRGRPPKQAQKLEMEPQITTDIYTSVPAAVRPFLFTPEISSVLEVTFSSRFETGEELLAQRRQSSAVSKFEEGLNNISQKLVTLQQLSGRWMETGTRKQLTKEKSSPEKKEKVVELNEEERILYKKLEKRKQKAAALQKEAEKPTKKKPVVRKLAIAQKAAQKPTTKKKASPKKKPVKRIMPIAKPKAKAKKPTKSKAKAKTTKRPVRRITPQKAPAKKRPLAKLKKITPKSKAKKK